MEEAKYKVITDYIENRINSGNLVFGEKLPSENVLTTKFNVSRDTVRRGFRDLEEKGYIERRKGSGTFVKYRARNNTRIAVVTTYVENYIFPSIIKGIGEVLSEEGYTMQLSFTNNTFSKEREVLTAIIDSDDVAGIIMEPVKSALPNPNLDCYAKLKDMGIPVLFVNSYYSDTDIPHVSLNDEEMGYIATRYLIGKGHRKIGAILKMDDGQGHLRFAGFRRALTECGINDAADNVVWFDTRDEDDINKVSDHIKERLSDKTAVFCYNDKVAVNFCGYLKGENVRIPEDVSIISMDNSMLAEVNETKITSCQHPKDELGRQSARNLIELIKDSRFDATREFITNVFERDSVKKI